MTRYLSTLLILFFAAFFPVLAQEESPVTWNASVRMTSETSGVLYIRANISQGWHLYSTSLPEGGPKPTSFSFSETKGVSFSGPVKAKSVSVEKMDPQFGISLSFYEETALFVRDFTLNENVTNAVIKVKVSFMGCNDQTCLPPNNVILTVPQSKFRKPKK